MQNYAKIQLKLFYTRHFVFGDLSVIGTAISVVKYI